MSLKRRLEGELLFLCPMRLEEVQDFLEDQRKKSLEEDNGKSLVVLNDFFGLGNLVKLNKKSDVESLLRRHFQIYRLLKPSSLNQFKFDFSEENGKRTFCRVFASL